MRVSDNCFVLMSYYSVHNLRHYKPEHEYYYGYGWNLWQIISLIIGLIVLCVLIGICINCFRGTAGMVGGPGMGGVYI